MDSGKHKYTVYEQVEEKFRRVGGCYTGKNANQAARKAFKGKFVTGPDFILHKTGTRTYMQYTGVEGELLPEPKQIDKTLPDGSRVTIQVTRKAAKVSKRGPNLTGGFYRASKKPDA